jgi:hypothetical protein
MLQVQRRMRLGGHESWYVRLLKMAIVALSQHSPGQNVKTLEELNPRRKSDQDSTGYFNITSLMRYIYTNLTDLEIFCGYTLA